LLQVTIKITQRYSKLNSIRGSVVHPRTSLRLSAINRHHFSIVMRSWLCPTITIKRSWLFARIMKDS